MRRDSIKQSPAHQLKRAAVLLGYLLTLLVSTPAFAISIANLDEPVSIAGSWKFQTGDNPAWADPAFNDGDWQQVLVPARVPEGHSGYTGIAWYRMRIDLNLSDESTQAQLGALAITLGSIASAYEVYIGGNMAGGVGRLPPEPSIRYDEHKTYPVPRSAINEQGEILIALRIWRYEGAGEQWEIGPWEGPYLIGNVGQLTQKQVTDALLPNVVLSALYLVVGLYHLLIARRNPAMREFAWFGWLAIALGLYAFETSQWKYALDIPYILHKKIELTSLYLAPFLFQGALTGITGIRVNYFMRGLQTLFALFAASIVLIPNHDIHFLTLLPFQYMALFYALCVAVLMAHHARLGNRTARYVLGLMILMVVAVVIDMVGTAGPMATSNVIHFAFAVVIVMMAVLMANRYTATLTQLELSVEEHTVDLQRANEDLTGALAVKEQFLATMSHELRTPMNAIMGLTDLTLKTNLDPQQQDYVGKVGKSARALNNIIEDMLDFSSLESGELEVLEEPFALAETMDSLEYIATEAAQEKGLAFKLVYDPAIPSTMLGDTRRLSQVLTVLTGNAIKFTAEGEVSTGVAVIEETTDSITLRFAVADTGIGLTEEQQAQLFTEFSQADASFTREYGGTGLGLAIAQRLTALMGSTISVESQPGTGSTFSFDLCLPLAQEGELGSDSAAKLGEIPDLSPIRGSNILVVDDSDINLQIACELLHQEGMRTAVAHDGSESVAAVQQQHFDCVLMDLQMPVMDGHTAARHIRSDEKFSDLPILALTANTGPEDRRRAAEAGMNDHIAKPIDPDELFRKLLLWIAPGERELVVPEVIEESSQSEELQLPAEIPGLSVAEGLTRVGGNAGLYLKLLVDMQRNYADVAPRIAQFLEDGESDAAAQLAHKLRGIANNLGAVEVGSYATNIESTLKSGGEIGEQEVSVLQEAIDQVLISVAELEKLKPEPTESGAVSAADISATLKKLRGSLEMNDPGAEAICDELLSAVDANGPAHEVLNTIRDSLEMFDFDRALQHMSSLESELA